LILRSHLGSKPVAKLNHSAILCDKADEVLALKIIGHRVDSLTFSLYAGDPDRPLKVEAMAKVKY